MQKKLKIFLAYVYFSIILIQNLNNLNNFYFI